MASALEGTRLKIMAIIRERGSATVEQLAREAGLSSATIRRHLDILQRDQLVSFQQSHKQLGRPEFVYSLTEAGHESGYRDYQTLLTLLLDAIKGQSSSELANKEGPDILALLMSRVSDQLSARYPADHAWSKDDRLARLKEALSGGGYEPQIQRLNGHVEVRLCNCPFRAAALCDGSICLSDQRVIANFLGVAPVRQYSIRNGDPFCSYLAEFDD